MAITVLTTERFTLPGYTALALELPSMGSRRGISVAVKLPNEDRLVFSKLDHEAEWHLDTHYPAGSCWPTFHNGQGARCTIPQLAIPAMADLLDAAAQAEMAEVV